jgi:hypothetical protein
MHRQGSSSWQFGHGDMGYLHTALFVRDAAGLPVPPSADIPPRLARDVPDYAGLLPPGQRAPAGKQWAIWWRRLVRQAVIEARRSVTPLPAGAAADDVEVRNWYRFAGRKDVFDPPDFKTLAPPLQSAVTATFESSLGWSGYEPSGAEPERFAWPLVRDAAESTAADLGIPVGDVKGYADVLEVRGLWSYLAGPGCALCSAGVARNPSAAAGLLRELFSSGHGRPAGLAR